MDCGNERTWYSQPMVGKEIAGDLVMVAATEVSGSTFGAINDICTRANVNFMSESQYYQLRHDYYVDAVKIQWKKQQAGIIAELGKKPCKLAGDGRFDSPGHSAQYNCYTIMEGAKKRIVDLEVYMSNKDCRGAAMEKKAMEKCMNRLVGPRSEHKLKAQSITTDQSTSIAASLEKNYIQKKLVAERKYDPWHVVKTKLRNKIKVNSYLGVVLQQFQHMSNNILCYCRI